MGEQPRSIEPAELYERLASGSSTDILDLRNRDEVQEWAIEGPDIDLVQRPAVQFLQSAVHGTVAEDADDLGLAEPLVVCAEGDSSARVADILRDVDIDATTLEGGMEAWARFVVSEEIQKDPTLIQYVRPASGCVSTVIVDGAEAAIVDPLRMHVEDYIAAVRERDAEVVAVLDTHVHADHVSGLRDVASAAGIEPTLPQGARDRGLKFEASLLADGDELRVGETTLDAIHAPGHTTEMTAIRVNDVLLAGDSVFLKSVARPDLQADLDPREGAGLLYETIHDRFMSLPGETLLVPGHVASIDERSADGTYTATLDAIVAQLDLSRETFVERLVTETPPQPANADTIVDVNLGRTAVDASRAFELELGPNNCAVSA